MIAYTYVMPVGDGDPDSCRVYWGSHGCDLRRGHDGPCLCASCWDRDDTEGYVGAWPYYGPETHFYGEDAVAKWGADRPGGDAVIDANVASRPVAAVNWTGIIAPAPIPGLDPGIAPWVELLRAWRIETHESCQGGAFHAYPEPTIAFDGGPGAGAHAYSVARAHDLPVRSIRRVWKEQDGELTGPVWQIVFRRQATAAEAAACADALAFERGER